MGYCAVLFALS